ncbi:MAG TPA: hypothetical protein VGG39_14120 [Polyangiaceae bacterium]|jgi:hypothetical protein
MLPRRPSALLVSLPLCLVLLPLAGLSSCAPTSLPGTALGTFKVTGTSTTNTCGIGAPNPWTFDVQLSKDGSTLYWSWMDGSPPSSGTLTGSSDSQATITDSTTGNVDGTDASLGPCTLQRDDDMAITLASTSFTGTLSYSFTVASGSDCDDQLVSSGAGGQYETLPCTVSYTLTGSQQ